MKELKLGRLDVRIDGDRATLIGRIDDSVRLGDLLTQLPAGDLVIDSGGVSFVNSVGMREWTRLLRALRQRGRVTLERVADVLMTQMNLIGGLAVEIRSFHAQYLCPACGGEHAPLVDAVANADGLRRMVAPPLPCPECGEMMELADFPERYLSIFKV
jgi:hypothetical protein